MQSTDATKKTGSSKTGTIVLIAALGGAAILMAIAAAYAYNANKKKHNGGGGDDDGDNGDDNGNNNNGGSTYDEQAYNFYPGLDMISGVADKGHNPGHSVAEMADICSTTDGCVAFNDSGYFSSVVLPVDQWSSHRARFGTGFGTHVSPQADPYSAMNSPDDPWVYYPGVSFDGAITPVNAAPTGTALDTLRQTALDAGYAAFTPSGVFYATVPIPKVQWPVSSKASGVYVHRDHMPSDY